MELWQFLGNWHPKLVQFPLVLLLVGLLLDAWGAFGRSARARWAGLVVSGLGTLSLLFAFICGIYAEVWAGRSGVPQHPIELHELMANVASWGFVILFAWRLLLAEIRPVGASPAVPMPTEVPRLKWLRIYVVVGLAWYSLLAVTGYLGGQLVFQYGAGVQGAHPTVLDLSDLNALATRQTDENLRYSEWMHHIFGWMTLGLAVSLMAQALWPKAGRKLAWIVPVFLLAGGVFLFFMADLDLYKFTDPRQFRDREVQLHKVIATVMGTVGAVGLWRLVRGGKRNTQNAKLETQNASVETRKLKRESQDVELTTRGTIVETPELNEAEVGAAVVPGDGRKASNSKLVAVLALIGGALLFTHVHTVAPYANVAAGVYIAHVVLGLIALSIGAARMLQDYLPRWTRALAMLFAVLMLAESVLLITYNEGLPWYIGYGRYNRAGPHGGTVAPYGSFRAEMVIDPAGGGVDVYVLDRFADTGVKAYVRHDAPPRLLLTRGSQDIALDLQSADPELLPESKDWCATHFHAQAEFLKNTPMVSARLELAQIDRNGAITTSLGYFDPWVTPAIAAVPPNELAAYECPMHQGMRAVKEDGQTLPPKCPLCGMTMAEIRPPLPAGILHDPEFALGVEIAPPEEGPAHGARILLSPRDQNRKPLELAKVHEQFMHLILVSSDLTFFDHVHPLAPAASDAPYVLPYTFPKAGSYILYADLTPAGQRQQIFRQPIEVTETDVKLLPEVEARNALRVDAGTTRLVEVIPAPITPQHSTAWHEGAAPGNVLAELTTQPRALWAEMHSELIVHLTDAAGTPLTDLSPYLGAMGHCVAISEDTRDFIHAHPLQLAMSKPEDRGGPDVAFHAMFPKPGKYRVWMQFRRGDKLIDACFTVDVTAPPVSPAILRFLLNE